MIQNKNIIVNGLVLNYYYSLPKKSKGTLLFLHGWGVDSKLWFKIIPFFSIKNYSLYFLDLPGFGKSQTPSKNFNLSNYSDIVKNFIEKVGLRDYILIGHSFGGSILIKLASKTKLNKIILANTSGIREKSFTKSLKNLISKIISPIFKPSFMQPIRQKLYEILGSEYLNIPSMANIFKTVVSEDLTPILSKIDSKTLIISGSKDKITPVTYGYLMKQKIKNSKLIILDAGHFSFLDKPNEFVKEINDFI